MTIDSLDVMRILNDPLQCTQQLSLQFKLAKYIQEGSVGKIRTLLSGYGKSKNGFDALDPKLKAAAFEIMRANGYAPALNGYKTEKFTIAKVQ